MLNRTPFRALAVSARLLAILFFLSCYVPSNSDADAQHLPTSSGSSQSGAVGELRYLGTYPADGGNNTVTVLSDDKLLLYGVRMDAGIPGTGKALTLRNRRESGAAAHL